MESHAAIDALAALAHETRLAIFRLLVRYGPDGLAVGQIAEHVPIPPATLSFHLSHLQRSGLLNSRRVKRQIIYSTNMPFMATLMAFMTEHCCEAADNTVEACQKGSCQCAVSVYG